MSKEHDEYEGCYMEGFERESVADICWSAALREEYHELSEETFPRVTQWLSLMEDRHTESDSEDTDTDEKNE